MEIDGCMFVEGLMHEGAPWTESKLLSVWNAPGGEGYNFYFDPDCVKLRATVIFHKIGEAKLTKTAEQIQPKIDELLRNRT